MSFSAKDTEAYRDDEKVGHKNLSVREREKLVESRSRKKESEESYFGVRKFLKSQLYLVLYILVHAVFSVYIRIRGVYHAVHLRVYSILKYHHTTPDYVRRDVSTLKRLPKHLSVILTLEDGGRAGDALEKLIREASEVAAWCASAGIPRLSIYERTGILKRFMPQTHRALGHKLKAWFGKHQTPPLSLSTRGASAIRSPNWELSLQSQLPLEVVLISQDDGREAMVDLTRVLVQMVQKEKISTGDITVDVLDSELSEAVMPEPDLLISFKPYVDLQGYPPWPIRLTEIYCAPDNDGVGYQVAAAAADAAAAATAAAAAGDDDTSMGLFRPPAIPPAAVGVLDRSLFSKTVGLAAAAVADKKKIAAWRQKLAREQTLLSVDRISSVVPHPDPALASQGTKCLLLDPKVKAQVPETWTPALRDGVTSEEIGIVPYDLLLAYDYWSYDDVMRSVLPPDVREENDGIPGGFNHAGHVAHMNLRETFLPYRRLLAEVLLDKNPSFRTVINKVAHVGTESEFRTFAYEVLAGPDDLNVVVRENGCTFRFNYAKVYWNSKLENEHRRLVDLFQPGEAVCDVMTGIGPFAVPAGKKGVFVWANDYNPESYRYLGENIQRNKVGQYVRPFNRDGRTFITEAADLVYAASTNGECAVVEVKTRRESWHQHPGSKTTQAAAAAATAPPEPKRTPIPPTISHFVMNLPASAITFLPHFRGLYAERQRLFAPHTGTKLPLIHVHCFAAKAEDDTSVVDICDRISAELGVEMKPGDAESPREVSVLEVRAVAPNKCMFCASFRLPGEVAFAARS
ncbi:Met-10+ like-protein-domain-containing protein [Durotheca rogersii]|uniref:Met-10+ like-protein-domain-containing protein n=1 Tax=Durotheca rogersii TaxID=419775 RepID=UPI002220AE3B|nr:Met-10+ like-protein-domain-containing protein [Durotheca rogersii]KAI5866876.1 Met-10+ like-protein-domain-containing protein [Durotheca rogersii]